MPEDPAKGTVLKMVPKPPADEEVKAEPSPEAMLLDLLARVRAGWRPHKLVVHGVYTGTEHPGLARHIYWSYGVANQLEHLGMLDLARYSLLTETNS